VTIAPVLIDRLAPHAFPGVVEELADLLVDAVASGGSLGFLDSHDQREAAEWWRAQETAVAAGRLVVWVARGPGGVDGTVSLAFDSKPNARHRGEIVKLMVHRRARGRGLGRQLLATAEAGAARAGLSLLILDTETGSAAERLYVADGWTRYGIVPDYAVDPAGTLRDCSFFYKRLISRRR
jgi:GNAT superfamily N-acetyltransferase